MRTLDPDLATAQHTGYPTGGYQPAVRCIFYTKNEVDSYDYSFDPTETTNTLLHAQQIEERESDSGIILIQNNDKTVQSNLTGYHVALGWGHNTADGIKWGEADGATAPWLWVMQQSIVSGAPKGSQPQIYSVFQLQGVWSAILNRQPVRLGTSPLFRYGADEAGNLDTITDLTDLTVYECIKFLLGGNTDPVTGLSSQTGLSLTLDDLGDQDDGLIDSVVPFPDTEDPADLLRYINANTPGEFQTYGNLIVSLLSLTNCFLVPKATLGFRIMYPQAEDSILKTYYSSISSGHPFYEVEDRRLNMSPNHIEVYGGSNVDTGLPDYVGDWFDPDYFSSPPTRPFTPADIEDAFDGQFMPVTNTIWETGLGSDEDCDDRAEALGKKLKDQLLGTRVILPMDASVELYDRISIEDSR